MSLLSEVAQALTDHLAGLAALEDANVSFSHFSEVSPEDLAELTVIVSPRGADVLVAGKRAATYEYRVGVYIAKRVADEAAAAAAMEATEAVMAAIHDDSWGQPNDGIGFSSMTATLNQDETMSDSNTFRAAIEVTYKVLRGP